jgi:DNA ligase (NAD+)
VRPLAKFQKVEHLTPMGSLEKVTTDEALVKWADDVRKRLDSRRAVAYVLEPKIDGLAINLTYENGCSSRGATRGRRRQGEDVTVNLRTIPSIPLRMRGDERRPLRRGARRGLHAALGFRELNERLVAEGKKPRRTRATPAARARSARRTRRSPPTGRSSVWAYGIGARTTGASSTTRMGVARSGLRSTRLRTDNPLAERLESSRGARRAMRGVGAEAAARARLRDRRAS